jgi:protein-L-isoaspartate(D-aspartate) O-methyltransferase
MDLTGARERMVIEQLERRGIKDARVLAAMRAVPRDCFIPAEYADHAYDDGPLPIGSAQTISQPYLVALMSEVAALQAGERVLEVGTGSGYQTAVLARLTREVYSIECIAGLQDRGRVILNAMGVTNVFFRCTDGSEGWPEISPFDAILVTAAMPGIPRPLLEQLAPAGTSGRAHRRRPTADARSAKPVKRRLARRIFRRMLGFSLASSPESLSGRLYVS